MTTRREGERRAGSDASGPVRFSDRVVLIFVDGLGVGDGGRDDPTRTYGGDLFDWSRSGAAWRPIDALLGISGIPQSATGQTSLFTGRNAQAVLGHHSTGFPGPVLREMLREHSLLKTLIEHSRSAAFLNAFRPLFWELSEAKRWTLSASTVANLAADLPFFTLDDLASERSVYQDVTNGDLRRRGFDVPEWTPGHAGRVLARNVGRFDFTLFEYFKTDKAGHTQDRESCESVLQELDGFVRAYLEAVPPGTLTLLTSDHGNIEDLGTRSHTINPVPLMAWGPGETDALAACADLTDIAPFILSRFVLP